MKKEIILITSNEPWGDIWYSKHHYANELAKLGHRVYFINPPDRWRIHHLFSISLHSKCIEDNLNVISVHNNFPIRILTRFFTYINDILNGKKIFRHIKSRSVIWWKFDPLRFLNPSQGKQIYHVADPYMHFWHDKYHSANADLIICTTVNYISFYKNKGSKVLYIPHGVSNDEFITNSKTVQRIFEKFGNFAVLVGNINNTYDFKLIKILTKSKIPVLILGGDKSSLLENILKKDKFIHYIGIVKAQELKNYIKASSCCLITYRRDLKKSINSGSTLKLLNYLSQYKPVVSSIDSEIPELNAKAIYHACNMEEFIRLVKLGLNNKLGVDKFLVRKYLEENTYPNLIHKVFNELEE